MRTFKRGSTFLASCAYTPPAGGLANLIGAAITSQIRSQGELVADLVPTLAADGLSFTLGYAGDSSVWPVGVAQWDIRVVLAGQVAYTETVRLCIENNITRPA